jgi:HEAT repeat protein
LGDVLRGTSAVILGSFRDNRAFEPLVTILLNNKNSLNLRLDAIYGLDNLGNEQATGPLMKTLSAERDIDLLQAVIVTLGKIGDESSLEPLNEIAQSHTDEDIRGAAQEAMAKIKSRLGQR